MSDTTPIREGGCRCGQVRFRLARAPLMTMACHCRGCQRMTASAFSLSVAIPRDGFEVIAGTPAEGGARSSDTGFHHRHCDRCKSWLFTEVPPEMGFVNVRTTMLDDPAGLDPFIETQTAEKLPWAATPAAHSFDRFPAMDAYADLTAAYPAWAAARLTG